MPIEQPLTTENNSLQNVFANLYTRNPVRVTGAMSRSDLQTLNDPHRFDKGIVAGVGIIDLERQGEALVGGIAPAQIFDHKTHDAVYLSHDNKDRGFTQNIAGAVKSSTGPSPAGKPGALTPAVTNIDGRGPEAWSAKSIADKVSWHEGAGNEQFFPFLFTTENRAQGPASGPFQQVCYLQATIASMNESYAPNWQSKHFFGRTEQVHTYTNTDRTIDISFMVHAEDMRRLQNVWERVNWLAQQTYGQYDGNSGRLGGGPLWLAISR